MKGFDTASASICVMLWLPLLSKGGSWSCSWAKLAALCHHVCRHPGECSCIIPGPGEGEVGFCVHSRVPLLIIVCAMQMKHLNVEKDQVWWFLCIWSQCRGMLASIFYGLCICPVLQVRIDASKLNPDAHAIKSMILCHRRCLSNMSLCTSPLICGLDMTRTKLAWQAYLYIYLYVYPYTCTIEHIHLYVHIHAYVCVYTTL